MFGGRGSVCCCFHNISAAWIEQGANEGGGVRGKRRREGNRLNEPVWLSGKVSLAAAERERDGFWPPGALACARSKKKVPRIVPNRALSLSVLPRGFLVDFWREGLERKDSSVQYVHNASPARKTTMLHVRRAAVILLLYCNLRPMLRRESEWVYCFIVERGKIEAFFSSFGPGFSVPVVLLLLT